MNVLKFLLLLTLLACTYTISVNHTEGVADEVGDESPTASADVSGNTLSDWLKK